MSRQSTLSSDDVVEESVVFYREVKSSNKLVTPENETIDGPSEIREVEELLNGIKRKLRYPLPIRETRMDELHKHITNEIIEADSAVQDLEGDVTTLLSQFCSHLQGRQRETNKYAMLVHFGSSFLLAHVSAEIGMSIDESEGDIELVRRFLDVDNILSAALFEIRDSTTHVSHFTDTDSGSFRDFVGVTEKKFHYLKKNIQIVTHYRGRGDIDAKFEFSNNELEDIWLVSEKIDIVGDRLVIGEDDIHEIKEIRWGSSPYLAIDAFKSDFKDYSYGVEGEFRRYQNLHSAPTESSHSIYRDDVEEVIDRRDEIDISLREGREIIDKGDLSDELHVLFANSNIKIDGTFATDLFRDMVNGSSTSIYHAASESAPNELEIGNLDILNIDQEKMSNEAKKFYNTVYSHMRKASGQAITRSLGFILLDLISNEVDLPFGRAINQIINVNQGNPKQGDVVITREGEGGGLIEYKNAQSLEKDNAPEDIYQNIKRKSDGHLIFLWGITEQTRSIDGLPTQRWNDDRITAIENSVEELLEDDEDIDYNEFSMRILPLGEDGNRWVISGILY